MKFLRKLLLAASVSASFGLISCSYNSDFDFQQLQAQAMLEGITMTNRNETIVVTPKEETTTGLIFYPGAMVHYDSYLPLMVKCAEQGIKCFLIQMPADLALLDISAADRYIADYPEITDWYFSGHSLGGAMGGTYLADNADKFTGLVFLAAYSTDDLSRTNLKVLSLYGENDHVLQKEKYEAKKSNLPPDFKEYVIPGGNHGNFGCYGHQKGDGTASISADEQQKETAELIGKFVRGEL